jgi:hypothetical protein
MNTETDDKLLRDFFNENKKEIPDIFFSNKVMQKLPERKNHEWIVVVLAGLGSLLSLILGWNNARIPKINLPEIIIRIPEGVQLYYILGAVFILPFAVWVVYSLSFAKGVNRI